MRVVGINGNMMICKIKCSSILGEKFSSRDIYNPRVHYCYNIGQNRTEQNRARQSLCRIAEVNTVKKLQKHITI